MTNGQLIKCEIISDTALPAESLDQLNSLIRISQTTCPQITTIEDKKMATERGVQMQSWIKQVKEAKAKVKLPLNVLLDNIDALAEQLLNPATLEKERLGRLITQFDEQEAKRVEREKREREQKIAAAQREADALAKVAEGLARVVQSEDELAKAIEAENSARDAAVTERELIVAPVPSSERIKGTVANKQMSYTVTDIRALYAARPDLCTLTENRAAIRACVVEGMQVPGLDVTWTKRTIFRT